MTTKTQPDTTGATARQGFQPIPTRISDVRDVPTLVVQPMDEQTKAEVAGGLEELGCKLAAMHRSAAEAWLSQSAYEKALPHLEAAATFAPTEIEYANQLGFVRYITGDDAGAINAFNTVINSDQTNASAWFNLGMVLYGQQQFGDAEKCFANSIQTEANDSQAWNNRGVCLFQTDRAAEAKICFQRAMQIDPKDADAVHNLQNMA